MTIRVLVIDDSTFMQKRLSELIASHPGLAVVGAAGDAETAREMIRHLNPDVLTLDVHMPKTSGLEFLARLMRERPSRVVMVSASTREGSESTLKALELGAIDFIGKPRADSPQSLAAYGDELAEKIRTASRAHLSRPGNATLTRSPLAAASRPALAGLASPPQKTVAHSPLAPRGAASLYARMIFVGASTGGTEAIKRFLRGMPEDCPPILIVQHMPETFTPSFAALLNSISRPQVLEAQGGEIVRNGTVYIAPGHSHLIVCRDGTEICTGLTRDPPVNHSRPSVDVLFASAAEVVGKRAIGVILTGMGRDGAQGMLKMRQAGAATFGQDEASCVVYGMPREAFRIGAVEEVVTLDQMAACVLSKFGKNPV